MLLEKDSPFFFIIDSSATFITKKIGKINRQLKVVYARIILMGNR